MAALAGRLVDVSGVRSCDMDISYVLVLLKTEDVRTAPKGVLNFGLIGWISGDGLLS
jgi:hypothetical protein